MSRIGLRRSFRVMRQSANTATVACNHRSERVAYWCAQWKTRRTPAGVYYEVFPAVTA